jgi:molybdenum cofactor cytidylyltransferase
MGRQKLLLPLGGGRSLVRASVEQVLAARPDAVVVVLGAAAGPVAAALAGLPVRTVLNPRYAEGQSTSLRAGLDAVPVDTEAVVVALGDQPLADPAVMSRLIDAFRATGRPIAVPRYADGRGHPVLLAAAVFDEVRAVSGDQGARGVVARDPVRVAEVPVAGPMPRDVDTPDDYHALTGGSPGSAALQ